MLLLSSRAFQQTPKGHWRKHSSWGCGSSSPCAPEGLNLGRCRRGGGGTTNVMEYHGVDEEDERTGGGGAPAVSGKTRA
jgi:hypothetical protein